jgi:hypothetical protein
MGISSSSGALGAADIKRWLNRYIARNQSDFFIHKRLREALAEDLDMFIKTEVLNANQLLVESLVYLLGLDVQRLYREVAGVVLTRPNRHGQSVLVLFRDCGFDSSADWLQAKLKEHPADRLYTNDPASLTFEGCERFESIEEVFALQFGRD